MICRFRADLQRSAVSKFPIMLKIFADDDVRTRWIEVHAIVLVTMGDATGETGGLTRDDTARRDRTMY
jgi:hypothetical protein